MKISHELKDYAQQKQVDLDTAVSEGLKEKALSPSVAGNSNSPIMKSSCFPAI